MRTQEEEKEEVEEKETVLVVDRGGHQSACFSPSHATALRPLPGPEASIASGLPASLVSRNARGHPLQSSKIVFLRRTWGLLAQSSLPCTMQNVMFCDLVAFVLLGDML